eukprot:1365146-Amorphochlora_amoeboformis.AAC.1
MEYTPDIYYPRELAAFAMLAVALTLGPDDSRWGAVSVRCRFVTICTRMCYLISVDSLYFAHHINTPTSHMS